MPTVIDSIAGKRVDHYRWWLRFIVTTGTWRDVARAMAAGRATLLGLWGDS